MTIKERIKAEGRMLSKAGKIIMQSRDLEQFDARQIALMLNNYNSSRTTGHDRDFVVDGYAGNSDVYSIVSYMGVSASAIKFVAKRPKGDEMVPLDEWHPVAVALRQANPFLTFREFINNLLAWKYIMGNTYFRTLKPESGVNKGKPVQLEVLPAPKVKVSVDQTTKNIIGYLVNDQYKLTFEDVCHIKYFNPLVDDDGLYYGMSPLRAGLKLLNMSNAAYEAEEASLKSGGMKGIVSGKSEDRWTADEAKLVQAGFERDYMTARNYGKIMFLSSEVNWQQLGVSPMDLGLFDGIKLTKQQLCAMYRFPSQLLNDKEGSQWATYKEAKKVLYTDAILPEIAIVRDALQKYLADPWNEDIVISTDTSGIEVLQADMLQKAQWLSQMWWIKGSDKQRQSGQAVDEALDDYFIPIGMQRLSDLDFGMSDDEAVKLFMPKR